MEERIKELEEKVEMLAAICYQQNLALDALGKREDNTHEQINKLSDICLTLRSYCELNGTAIKKLAKGEPIN